MRINTWTCLAVLLCCVPGCGSESVEDADEVRSKSKASTPASTPVGAPVKVAYDYGVGDGVRMTIKSKGTMKMSGPADMTQPTDMTMVIAMQCTKVLENGDRELEFRFEEMSLPGGLPVPAEISGMKGTATAGADGRFKDMTFDGVDPAIAAALKKSISGGGFSVNLPFPPEGLRVGETIDLKDVVPEDMFADIAGAMPGMDMKMEVEGEYVLMGTKTVDGVDAAEFKVTMLMVMTADIEMGEETTSMETRTTTSGTLFIDLRTGFPVGMADTTTEQEMEMSGGGQDMKMSMKATATTTCERLK